MDEKQQCNGNLSMYQEITFGEFVLLQRKAKGMTQKELAKAAGVSRNYISYIEQDKSSVTLIVARHVSEALGYKVVVLKDSE